MLLEILQNSLETPVPESPILQKPTTLVKKILWHRCFPVSLAIFLRTPFLQNIQNTSGRLLLPIVNYFSVKSCLRTVDQHYSGRFLVQFWLRQIKTMLHMVICLQKDDYKFAAVCRCFSKYTFRKSIEVFSVK